MKSKLPLVTLVLGVLVLGVYVLELAGGGMAVCAARGLIPARLVSSGELAPLLTHLFLHDPNGLLHLAGNVVFLAIFGTIVERNAGHMSALALFVGGGIVGGLLHVVVDPSSVEPMVGCSGSVFALAAVAAAIDPRRWLAFVVTLVGWNIWLAWGGSEGGVSFGTHLGGFFVGSVFALVARRSSALEAA